MSSSYGLHSLPALSADIDTEHTVTTPFTFSREAVEANDVVQCRFHRPTFDVDPFERRRTMRVESNLRRVR